MTMNPDCSAAPAQGQAGTCHDQRLLHPAAGRLPLADPHRDSLLHHEPKDVCLGLPEGRPEPQGDRERLHWILGVKMREDDMRNWAGHSPVNLAAVRRLVLNRQDDKLSFRRRLLKAA